MDIAFFGLGAMGLPMALNLVRAGHTVRVFPHAGRMDGPERLAAEGGTVADSLEDAVCPADCVCSIVPDDDAVRDIFLNPRMRDAVKPGVLLIEMSSIHPDTMLAVRDYYTPVSARVIDAPVTGGRAGAVNGTLIILGGGDAEDFAQAEPVFAPLARTVFQLGAVGQGKLVKAMNNLLAGVNLAAACEFFRFARKQGVNMERLQEVLPVSSGASAIFSRKLEKICREDFSPDFALKLMRKDMAIALQIAEKAELSMPMAEFAFSLYVQAENFAHEDCCAVLKVQE